MQRRHYRVTPAKARTDPNAEAVALNWVLLRQRLVLILECSADITRRFLFEALSSITCKRETPPRAVHKIDVLGGAEVDSIRARWGLTPLRHACACVALRCADIDDRVRMDMCWRLFRFVSIWVCFYRGGIVSIWQGAWLRSFLRGPNNFTYCENEDIKTYAKPTIRIHSSRKRIVKIC